MDQPWQGGIKGGKGAISTKSFALKNIRMALIAASKASLEPILKSSLAPRTPGASRWLCRSFSARPSALLSTWKPRPKSRSKKWPTVCHHGRPSNFERQGAGRRLGKIRKACRQRQGRLSGLQAAQRQNYSWRDVGQLIGGSNRVVLVTQCAHMRAFIILEVSHGSS
jgi:hypothetical protein